MAALIKRGGDGGRPILDNKPGLDYSVTKRAKGIPTTAEARNYPYPQNELAFVRQYRQVCVDGNPQQVKEKLETLAAAYQTDDLSIVTICHGYADRLRSYELVAEVCGLGAAE